MKCKKCGTEIPATEIARELGRRGGKASPGVITPEHQKKMQAARLVANAKKREKENAGNDNSAGNSGSSSGTGV